MIKVSVLLVPLLAWTASMKTNVWSVILRVVNLCFRMESASRAVILGPRLDIPKMLLFVSSVFTLVALVLSINQRLVFPVLEVNYLLFLVENAGKLVRLAQKQILKLLGAQVVKKAVKSVTTQTKQNVCSVLSGKLFSWAIVKTNVQLVM